MQWFTVFFVMLYMVMCRALTSEWDEKISVLYPSLPIVALWSENKSCRNHSHMLLQALNNFTLWAVQMLDSSAGKPRGVLFGNMYQLGNFDECLEVNGPVESQYCLAKVTVKVPHTDTIIDPYIQNYDPASSVWDKIKNDGNPARVPRSNVYQALCVPASCSPQDIENAVSQYLQKYKHPTGVQYTVEVAPNLCHTSQQEVFSFEDYIFMGVMAGVVMLVIAGTALDAFGSSQPGTLYLDLLFCFSARQNMRRLNHKSTSSLYILNSIKFICACIIILIHRALYFGASPLWNLEFLEKEYQTVRLNFLLHGAVLMVDTFFLISGLLVAYNLLQDFSRQKQNLLSNILFRFIRLTPALSVLVFFYATLLYKLGSGPHWDIIVGSERDYCQRNWWTNLLFINNYVNEQNMCLLQSYSLACDMHFFIIAIPVVMLLWRRPGIGAVVLSGLILASILIPFLVTYIAQKPALTLFYIEVLDTLRTDDAFNSVYIKSHTRASPYFLGIGMGYLLYKLRDSKQKLGEVPSIVLCLGAICLLIGVILFGIPFYDPARPYCPLEAGLYSGLHRFVWALGTSAFIAVIIFGKVSVISSLLSSKTLVNLGNLSYSMFLIHPLFFYWNLGSLQRPEYVQYTSLVTRVAGDIVLSLLAALCLYLTVEEPFRCMARRLAGKKATTKQD